MPSSYCQPGRKVVLSGLTRAADSCNLAFKSGDEMRPKPDDFRVKLVLISGSSVKQAYVIE